MRLFQVAKKVTDHIAFYLPKNSNIDQVSSGYKYCVMKVFGGRELKWVCQWAEITLSVCC